MTHHCLTMMKICHLPCMYILSTRLLWLVWLLFIHTVAYSSAQQDPWYIVIAENPQQTCDDVCPMINGTCNTDILQDISTDRFKCMNAFRTFIGRNDIVFANPAVDNNLVGGCVVQQGQQYIEIQTRTLSYECNSSTPYMGGWCRVCPCSISSVSKPSSAPTALPSELLHLNTVYLVGTNLSYITEKCTVGVFQSIFHTAISETLNISREDVSAISVYELVFVGSADIAVGISFRIRQSVETGNDGEISNTIENSIRTRKLIELLQALGWSSNCSLAGTDIGGFNNNLPRVDVDSDPCEAFHGTSWKNLYRPASYGPWVIITTVLWALAVGAIVVAGYMYSGCSTAYGLLHAVKFKFLWSLLGVASLSRLVYMSSVLGTWGHESFACAEVDHYTGSAVSVRPLAALQLIFYATSITILAGLMHVYHRIETSLSLLSTILSCITFGPYLLIFVVGYLVLGYGSERILSEDRRSGTDLALQLLFGCLICLLSCVWLDDIISSDYERSHILHKAVSVSFLVFGVLVVATSFPVILASPSLTLALYSVCLRIVELVVVFLSIYMLLEVLLRSRPSAPLPHRPPRQTGRRFKSPLVSQQMRRMGLLRSNSERLSSFSEDSVVEHKASNDISETPTTSDVGNLRTASESSDMASTANVIRETDVRRSYETHQRGELNTGDRDTVAFFAL